MKNVMTQAEFNLLPKDEQDQYIKNAGEMQKALETMKKEDQELKQMKMKDFKGMIDTIIEKRLAPMTKTDRKFFNMPGVKDLSLLDRTDPVAKWAKTVQFLNALVKKDVQTLDVLQTEQIEAGKVTNKAAYLNETTAGEGAILVPEEFAAEILRLSDVYGTVRANARHIPMKHDVMNFPAAGTTDVSTHWVNEASIIYGTAPSFRQIVLTINKLATIPVMTSELLADANVDVIAYLSDLIAEALAKEEDVQGLKGNGNPFSGCVNATAAPTYILVGTGFETLSYGDLIKMTSRVKTSAQANAKFYFHRSCISHVHSLITTAGAPIFPNAPNTVVGYPLVAAEVLPGLGSAGYQTASTTYAVFGDLKKALLFGERGTLRMKLLDQGTVGSDNLGEKDMVGLRVIERIAMGVALPSSICIIKTSA